MRKNNFTSPVDEQHEQDIDSMLSEISKYKNQVLESRGELRSLRNTEVKHQKTIDLLRTENERLMQEVNALDQKVRELEIQLCLPTNERTLQINQELPVFQKPVQRDTFRAPRSVRRADSKKLRWVYAVAASVAIFAFVLVAKFWSQRPETPVVATNLAVNSLADAAPMAQNGGQNLAPVVVPTVGATATSPAVEEGYLLIDNPIEKEVMVRVRDGFNQRAKEVAWVDPGTKYKIRAQSPNKMKRTFTINGQSYSVEDFFYKISDKDQWVFGFFTSRRTAPLPNQPAPAAQPTAAPTTQQ
ncbi:MAG: hypothetical protein RL757_1984 [Bacteroidota bacterium]|jgi:hypothetical protein